SVLKQHLINHARTFLFSTALPTYMAGQVLAALRLAEAMDAERTRLQQKALRFAAALAADGWGTAHSATEIIPVIVGENDDALSAAGFLESEGFAVRAIRPPTVPKGKARLRLSLTVLSPEHELTRLRDSLAAWRIREQRSVAAGCT